MLKEIKNLLSFLTIIPVRMDEHCLADCARFMFVFPLIGAFLGFLAGFFGWGACFFGWFFSRVFGGFPWLFRVWWLLRFRRSLLWLWVLGLGKLCMRA